MVIASPEQLETLRGCGRRLAFILASLKEKTEAGMNTAELDRLAETMIREAGGKPSFLGYDPQKNGNPFPGSLCVSINNEIVHGIGRADKIIKDGDIVKLDIGMLWPSEALAKDAGGKPLCTDTAITFGVGRILKKAEKLIKVTEESLAVGIATVKAGVHTGDVSFAIQKMLEKNNLTVVRELAGHGVGEAVHEEPFIPNFGKKGTGPVLTEGMVIALEPISCLGTWHIRLANDGWTYRTADGSLSAHFEHTMVVMKDRAEILTQV